VTFLERLQAHRCDLIHLKTQLYWYGGRGWDGNPGRLCLLLDAAAGAAGAEAAATTAAVAAMTPAAGACTRAHLLIDGMSQWVWVAEGDVEVLSETR
jgi:hypothetical protein